jgi:hypothetical protein
MSKSIYNISQELETIFNTIENNDGMVDEQTETAIVITQQELENKGVQYGFKCLSIKSENAEIDAEIERLTKFKTRNENLEKRLIETLKNAMLHFGIEEIKIPTLKINFRKSTAVQIDNEDLIDEKFKVEKITKSISKTLIKEAIEKGETVLGASKVENKSLQIK